MKAPENTKPTPKEILRNLNSNSVLKVWRAVDDVSRHYDKNSQLNNALLKLLKHGKRPFHRSIAAYALGRCGCKKAIPALERTLADKNEYHHTRAYAAEALADPLLAANRSIPVLIKCLRDPSKNVRFWCIYALGVAGTFRRTKARTAISALQEIAKSDKRMVRTYWPVKDEALWALAELEGREEDAKKISDRLYKGFKIRGRKSKRK